MNQENKVLNPETKESFEQLLGTKGEVLVDFWAPWCGPCVALAPKLQTLAEEFSNLRVLKVDVDQLPQVAAQYGVKSLPTLMRFKDGQAGPSLMGNHSLDKLKGFLKEAF